jgi:CelD/BcsL family acetyltransferase involved in cellulose biosynthesis
MEQRHSPPVTVRPQLGPLAPAWDAIVDQLPLPSPFLRSWWLEATAGRRPCFVLALDGQELLGGLALQQDRWLGVPRLRVMGAGPLCPDHLDVVAAPAQLRRVVAAVGSWLARPGPRVLDLEGMVADPRIAAALPGRVRREVLDVAPWSPLPADPEAYVSARPRNFRATLRKASRRFDREGIDHRVATRGEVDAALATLRDLHSARWGRRSHFLAAFEDFARAARAGAARGELALHELVDDETVLASVACFEVAGRVSLYQSGRAMDHRWRNAVTVLLGKVIEDACRRGVVEVDLLRGGEDYKRNFGSASRELLRLRAASGMLGDLALAALTVTAWARRPAGRLLRRVRSALPASTWLRPHGRGVEHSPNG